MKSRIAALVVTAFVLLLTGCMAARMQMPESYAGDKSAGSAQDLQVYAPAAAAPAIEFDSPASQPGASASTAVTLDVAATQPARIVIYSGALTIVVPDIARSLQTVRTLATTLGGYMQEIDTSTITVRVPAARFDEALAAAERLGEVTARAIKASDITEEMHDLKIRLENAEQTRTRLLAILEKMQKTEDVLKVEVELQRVTETVELLKGKIQYLASQAAFSTLRIAFNSPLPQQQMVAAIPFPWIRDLGNGLVTGSVEADPDTSRWRARNVRFELPAGYIRYFERDQLTEAMSAEGMLIKLQRHDNYDGGNADFWVTLAKRAMLEHRAIAIDSLTEITLDTKAPARVLIGTKDISNKPHGYMVALIVTKRYVYSLEAWGPKDQFAKDRANLEHAIKTLEINP